jgi:membrane protein insertase Oxa1/YidC/SpoIIIJ
MKNSKEMREKILMNFQEKYGVRPFNKDLPEWIK